MDGAEPDERPSSEYTSAAPVAAGTAIWAVLLVGLLLARHQLAEHGREWWIWSAVAGVLLGGVGYLYLRRRRAVARSRTTAR